MRLEPTALDANRKRSKPSSKPELAGSSRASSTEGPQLLTVREVAEIMRITEDGVRKRIERGSLPGVVRLGPRTIRIVRSTFLAWAGLK
jgi:excisionase family DNA binding protein